MSHHDFSYRDSADSDSTNGDDGTTRSNWISAGGCGWEASLANKAASVGDLEKLKALRADGCDWAEGVCIIAAHFGHLDVLRYAHKNNCPCDLEIICGVGAQWSGLGVVRYAVEHGCTLSPYIGFCASRNLSRERRIEVLEYLVENGFPLGQLDIHSYDLAIQQGDLELVKYLHSIGVPWGRLVTARAALYGKLDILKFADDNGCAWDNRACEMAADSDEFHIVKYVIEQGRFWDRGDPRLRAFARLAVYWPRIRDFSRKRHAEMVALGISEQAACAAGGAGRKRDRLAFEEDFV